MKVMSGSWKLWESESLDSLSMSNCKPIASWYLGLKVASMSEDQNTDLLFKKLTSYDKAVSFTRQNTDETNQSTTFLPLQVWDTKDKAVLDLDFVNDVEYELKVI